jgi:DNA-binding NarL/FixJ family response regulator
VTRTAVALDQSTLWLHSIVRVLPVIGFSVAASTTSPEDMVALVETHRPQLLVAGIDSRPNGIGDFSCVREARARVPSLQVVVLSNVDLPRAVKAAFSAGAAAYVLKTARGDDFTLAIRQLYDRSIYLAREVPVAEPAHDRSEVLTPRELEILQLVAEGHSNAELARMLMVGGQTVKFHLANIYQKLGVRNRTEASHWAHLHRVVSPERSVGEQSVS